MPTNEINASQRPPESIEPGVISVRLDDVAAEQLSRIVRGLSERTGKPVTTSDAVRDAIELASFTY